jgi:flagellar basal-body rod protein FlgB
MLAPAGARLVVTLTAYAFRGGADPFVILDRLRGSDACACVEPDKEQAEHGCSSSIHQALLLGIAMRVTARLPSSCKRYASGRNRARRAQSNAPTASDASYCWQQASAQRQDSAASRPTSRREKCCDGVTPPSDTLGRRLARGLALPPQRKPRRSTRMHKLIDAALGIHPRRSRPAHAVSSCSPATWANADTPGFKARDIDFRATMQALLDGRGDSAATLRRTAPGHQSAPEASLTGEPLYRIPNHPALDGNTVDTQLEQTAFAEASVRYQASLDFLDARIQGLQKALRGD